MKRSLLFLFFFLWQSLPIWAQPLDAGPYKVTVTTHPSSPVVGDNTVVLKVTADGQPAKDVTVNLHYDMVGMSMDMPVAELRSTGEGEFSTPVMLSMPGVWQLEVSVTGPLGKGQAKMQVKASEAAAEAPKPQQHGDLKVDLSTNPASPTVGDIPVTVTLQSSDGKPVNDSSVTVAAAMPGMTMELRPVQAEPEGDGRYQATVPLSMEGLWKLKVEVEGHTYEFSKTVSRGGEGYLHWIILALALVVVAGAVAKGWRPPFWQILVLAVLLAGVVALKLYADKKRPPDKSMGMKMDMAAADMGMSMSDMQAPVPVAVHTAEPGEVAMTVTYTGTVKPFLEETLYPRVEGYLLDLSVYPGDRVSANQVVGHLDREQLGLSQARAQAETQVAQAKVQEAEDMKSANQAGIEVAQADLDVAKKTAERAKAEIHRTEVDLDYWDGVITRERELYKAEAVSLEELEEKRSKYATAKVMNHHAHVDAQRAEAEVRAKEAALLKARRQTESSAASVHSAEAQAQALRLMAAERATVTDYTNLRSRLNGVVTERITDPGVLVRPGMGILKIARIDQVRLQFTVAEQDLPYIHRGTPVTITSQAMYRSLEGEVTSLFHAVDPKSRTGVVEVLLKNPDGDRLLPGTFVVGVFALRQEEDVLWVPKTALVTYYDEPTLWLVEEKAGQKVAVRRRVETGAESNERLEISDGLSAGDQVIVGGFESLNEDTPVTPGEYGQGIYKNLLLPKDAEAKS